MTKPILILAALALAGALAPAVAGDGMDPIFQGTQGQSDNAVTGAAQGKVERQQQRQQNRIDRRVDRETDEAVDGAVGRALDSIFD